MLIIGVRESGHGVTSNFKVNHYLAKGKKKEANTEVQAWLFFCLPLDGSAVYCSKTELTWLRIKE